MKFGSGGIPYPVAKNLATSSNLLDALVAEQSGAAEATILLIAKSLKSFSEYWRVPGDDREEARVRASAHVLGVAGFPGACPSLHYSITPTPTP
jgi:hypothetical protein